MEGKKGKQPSSRSCRERQGGRYCGAIGCHNARYKHSCKGKSFFGFPKDEQRCQRWIQNCRRQDLKGLRAAEVVKKDLVLCSDHFESSQFNVPAERRRLTWNAVPTLFDVPNPPPLLTPKRKLLNKPPLYELLPIKKSKFPPIIIETCNLNVTKERTKMKGDFPPTSSLDFVEAERSAETDASPGNTHEVFIKTENLTEDQAMTDDCHPRVPSVSGTCQYDNANTEPSSTEAYYLLHKMKWETSSDTESDMPSSPIVKVENILETSGDSDNTCTREWDK